MKSLLIGFLILTFGLLAACSDENQNNISSEDNTQDNEDIETLIETNRQLVERLEQKLEENEDLASQLQDLQDENNQLKDDILTYKQQAIETESKYSQELEVRDELDLMARQLFQYMHEREHAELEELTGPDITVDREEETLSVADDEDVERTFHYLQLDDVIYIRQRTFSLNHEDNIFTSEYEFYTGSEEVFLFDGGVELVFDRDEEWEISSIRYVQ